jgi:hypothetical protein
MNKIVSTIARFPINIRFSYLYSCLVNCRLVERRFVGVISSPIGNRIPALSSWLNFVASMGRLVFRYLIALTLTGKLHGLAAA